MNISKNYEDTALPNSSSAFDSNPLNYYNVPKPDALSSGNSLKNRVLSLKDTGSKLLNDGRINEGLDCYTTMFNVLVTMSDSDGFEFNTVFGENVEELNKIAMKYVQHNDTETGHKILSFCDEVSQAGKYGHFPLQRTQTLNNIACLYRRVGKPKGALNYLRNSLAILSKNNLMEHSAVTYLNLSAVQSQMGDHEQAFQNAKNALVYAQEEILIYQDAETEKYKEKVVMLAIVYHNMGAEEEHLQNLKSALDWYEKAFLVMDEYGVADEKLYQKFREVFLAAQEKFGNLNMHMSKRNASPMSATTPKRLLGSVSAASSPRDGFLRLPARQVKVSNVELHHRASPQGQVLKSFLFKDKRIVSTQPKLSKPPIMNHVASSSTQPRAWEPVKSSSSLKSLNPRPLYKDRVPVYKKSEGESATFFGHHKKPSEKLMLRDESNSRITTANDVGEENVDSDDSQAYYKVPVRPIIAKKKKEELAPIEKKIVEKKVKVVKPEEEIKALEDIGVLDWTDNNIDANKKKEEKEAIKKNQQKFFSKLRDAGVKTITGGFKLMDSSASMSSASSDSEESPKVSTKRSTIKKEEKKPQAEQAQQEAPTPENPKSKKDADDEGVEEDIEDEFSEQVSEEIAEEDEVNKSKLSKLSKRSNTSKVKSPISQSRILNKGPSFNDADKSKVQKSEIKTRQSFADVDKSAVHKSETKTFKESRVGVSAVTRQNQAETTNKIRASSKFDKSTKNELVLSSMQWNDGASVHDKTVESEEEPEPKVVLTRAQVLEMNMKKFQAAIFIQRNYRRRLRAERAKLIAESKKIRGEKVLIKKKWVILQANKTVGDTVVLEEEEHDYSLNVFATAGTQVLLFALNNTVNKLRYYSEVSFEQLEVMFDQPIKSSANMALLDPFCEDLIKRMYIVDHLLLFHEKKVEEKPKEEKIEEESEIFSEQDEEEIATKSAPVDFKAHEAKIIKVQSVARRKIAKQQYEVLKSRNFQFLYREVIKVDDRLIRFRIVQENHTKKVFLTAVHLMTRKHFNRLEVPEQFMEGLGRKPDDIINKLEFDFDEYEMSLLPAFEMELYPEKKLKMVKTYDSRVIMVIQRAMRKFLARKMFGLRLKKARENPNITLLKKYAAVENGDIFTVRIHHNAEKKHFTVRAKGMDYLADVPVLTIPVDEVDKNDFSDSVANMKRLIDTLIPYIKVTYLKKNETYVVNFDKRAYDRSTRRFEAQLNNLFGFEGTGNEEEAQVDKDQLQKKVCEFLRSKTFVETNKHILKNFLGLQTVVSTVKIPEDEIPDIKNFGGTEDAAAKRIQKWYRSVLMFRYFGSLAAKDKAAGTRLSASQILTNSVRGTSYSLFSKAYQRMMVSEDELRRQSNNDYFFVKTVSGIQFPNTKLEAKAHVFSNKTNPKEKTIDVEIIMPLIGLRDYLKISESDIFQNSIKPASFLKKIEEHLISKLEFDPIQKKVFFVKDGGNSSEGEMIERTKLTLTPYVLSKLTRLKFLRRKALTKSMTPITVTTTDVKGMFINMSFFWHVQKHLRVLVEQITDLSQHKEIIVKFDGLQNSKELRKLIDGDIKPDSQEFLEKMGPYLDYVSKHIIIQPEVKPNGVKRDYRIMMDGSIFKIEFVNSRYVVVSLKDISDETLKELMAKSAQGKFNIRASKLLDVGEYENLFPKKVDLKELLAGESKDKEGKAVDAGELMVAKKENSFKKKVIKSDREKAAIKIQKVYRGRLGRQQVEMAKARKAAEAAKHQSFGVKVKKVAKRVDDDYWTITVYQRPIDKDASMYYFFASNVPDGENPPKQQARGVFKADNMLFMNSDGKDLAETLLERIEINGQSVEFNMEKDNYVKFSVPTIIMDQEPQEAPTREVRVETQESQREERPKETGQTVQTVGSMGGLLPADNPIRLVTEESASPLDSATRYHTKKRQQTQVAPAKDPLPENLLSQKTEATSNNLLLYNVFLNNDDASLKPAENALIAEQKDKSRSRTRKDSFKLSTENMVKISIDMNELKKYNPNLAPKSPGDLRMIASELTNSIQVNERGEILINSSKLNPNTLNVLEKRLNVVENPNKDLEDEAKKGTKKKILFKMTKIYGDKKYLLVINYIEKPSSLNNILFIVRREDDHVYEEFDLFIEVNVVCLSNSAIRPITWELSLEEGQKLSGLANESEIAKFFAGNIHLFGDQILLSTPFQSSTNFKNVMIMNENAIKMIQNKFRSKKFNKNFNKFKENMIVNKTKIIARAVIVINNASYHVLGYDNEGHNLTIEAWGLLNYQKHTVNVSKKSVEKVYARDKKAAFNNVFRFLKFELNKKKEYVLALKEQNMFDYLRKQGEL